MLCSLVPLRTTEKKNLTRSNRAAEFRGPGVHHSSEADTEMFDHEDEDHDLDHQVHKGSASDDEELDASELRRQREGTPAPTGAPPTVGEKTAAETTTDSPSSVKTEKSEGAEEKKQAASSSTTSEAKVTPAVDGVLSSKKD